MGGGLWRCARNFEANDKCGDRGGKGHSSTVNALGSPYNTQWTWQRVSAGVDLAGRANRSAETCEVCVYGDWRK
jgi:hypothetical protein